MLIGCGITTVCLLIIERHGVLRFWLCLHFIVKIYNFITNDNHSILIATLSPISVTLTLKRFYLLDGIVYISIIELMVVVSHVPSSETHCVHTGLSEIMNRLHARLETWGLGCLHKSADKESVEVLIVSGYLGFDLLSLVIWLKHFPHILQDDDGEVFVHKVALLVPKQIHILFFPHDTLIDIILPPLIEVKDQIRGEVDWTMELVHEVYGVSTTVKNEAVSNSHRVYQGLTDLLDGFIPCNSAETNTEL